ncbi:MAG: hypothetical protein ACFE0Q_13285 [Anaerolineae bacterium]
MTTFNNETFSNEDVNVDGNQYDNCTFDTVLLIYQGGGVPVFNECTFRNVKIDLQGSASQTAGYLNSLYDAGLPEEVEQVISDVQAGTKLTSSNRPSRPPLANTGENYGQVLWGIGIILFIAVWFFGLYAYAFIFQPTNTLENGRPLTTQVDFALIPVLPDDLAVEYDNARDQQIARLNGGQVNEDGTTSISIENAMATLLQRGFVVGTSDDEVTTDESDSSADEDESSGD